MTNSQKTPQATSEQLTTVYQRFSPRHQKIFIFRKLVTISSKVFLISNEQENTCGGERHMRQPSYVPDKRHDRPCKDIILYQVVAY